MILIQFPFSKFPLHFQSGCCFVAAGIHGFDGDNTYTPLHFLGGMYGGGSVTVYVSVMTVQCVPLTLSSSAASSDDDGGSDDDGESGCCLFCR